VLSELLIIWTAVAVTIILRHGSLFDSLHFPIVQIARRFSPTWLGKLFSCGLCLGFWMTAATWLLGMSALTTSFALVGGAAISGIYGIGRTHNAYERVASLLVGAIATPGLTAFGFVVYSNGLTGFWDLGALCVRGAVVALIIDLTVSRLSYPAH
jgi:hypothetical protein